MSGDFVTSPICIVPHSVPGIKPVTRLPFGVCVAGWCGAFHLTTGISAKQSLPVDILVLVQETPFTDSQYKEINKLLKKGVFAIIIIKNIS